MSAQSHEIAENADQVELTAYDHSPYSRRKRQNHLQQNDLTSSGSLSVDLASVVNSSHNTSQADISPPGPTPTPTDFSSQDPSPRGPSPEITLVSGKRKPKFSDKLDLTPKLVRAVFDSPKSPTSRSSDSPIPPTRSINYKPSQTIKSMDMTSRGEVKVKTTIGGHYSVTPTDASLIERISHKVPQRSHRVLNPREVFVELEELRSDDNESNEFNWEETARWIKFEEDVEEDTGRWGRPHVSALAFHSVVDLRKGLQKGLIMLDVGGDNFPVIVDKIVDKLVECGQLQESEVDFVLQALYKKHKHQHQITLWDDLKQAARSADGTIHQIGDHIRQRHSFSTHNTLFDENVDDDHKENGRRSSIKNKILSTSIPEEHEVKFTINESDDTAHDNDHCSISIDDQSDQPKLKRSHPSSASMISTQNEEKQKLSSSVQDLLDKIPEHAESLTVLVGGVNYLHDTVVAFVRLEHSHLLGDLTEVPLPVRFMYLMLGPVGEVDYHEVGRAMATLMSDKCFHDRAYSASTGEELLTAMDQFLEDSLVLPPGDWDHELLLPLMHKRNELRRRKEKKLEEAAHHQQLHEGSDPLQFSLHCPGRGIVRDIKTLVKRYPRDFIDVFHIQPLIAILFIYISCVAPAIAFGGLMDEVTAHQIGVTETLVGTGACGILYGVFSVQPLTIVAFTGPLLLFEEIFIEFAHMLHIEYLSWRACIGLWLMLFIILFAISELSFLAKQFTRFSEEIFTGVIALFFTVEALRTIIKIYRRNPICGSTYPCGDYAYCTELCNCSNASDDHTLMMDEDIDYNTTRQGLPHGFMLCNQVNTALWSTLLCLCTFLIALLLRKFRESRFLGKQARRLVSDFGMLTAIATMVTISYILRETITIETLFALGWRVSNPEVRGWVINPLKNLEWYHIIGAIIPAGLLGVLICVENQLTLLLVNKHEHRLVKGVGYHFDLLLVGIFAGICGLFGLPWICAASVRSIQHLQALSRYNNKNAPGEKPKLLGAHEQRVTNIAVHVIIFLSPFAYKLLEEIPFSVIIGVFIYLAYASMSGIQLRKRIKLFFTPPKHHPDIHYVRKVRTWKMNLYTVIQVCLVGLLYGLKLSPAGMAYPVAIVMLIPLRMFLGKFVFTKVEMEALNSEDDFPEEDDDFQEYHETHAPY